MKILIVGSGGREHALAWKLQQSPRVTQIFCAPGNAGTALVGENVAIAASDIAGLARFAQETGIGLTVVGPDDPLAAGIVDLFTQEGLRIFGPTKAAARLESSKIFAKEMMSRSGIPTAAAGAFERSEEAHKFCQTLRYPVVIKADGLALGKGVIIAPHAQAAASAIYAMMEQRKFGEAGRRVLIEEFLTGWECSLHALVDGQNYQLLATARDHKRAFDGDAGPNTGGMGAFSPADRWSGELEAQFHTKLMEPLLAGLRREGVEFRGLLFPGLMVTADGARVLEFNCRFGDPETQVILPRLKSDLLPLLEATIDGNLRDLALEWDERPAVTVVLASGGYPDAYETGKPIRGLDSCRQLSDVHIFHAGTRVVNGEVVTSGGRVLAVTALGATISDARARAYEAAARIDFERVHYRRDIALSAVPTTVATK